MPWELRVSEVEVREAIASGASWRQVLDWLGYSYHGKNIATIRKWAGRWGIPTDHLTDHRGRRVAPVRYTERELREAVAASLSWAETLRRLGYCPTGGNRITLKKRVRELRISTDHFDPHAAKRSANRRRRKPLAEVLVVDSSYSRGNLKARLYEAGLKERRCELCGQGEAWNGRRISLILDHINGVRNDNRLENLRIVCPNCAAGLDTHCGRNLPRERECKGCGKVFMPNYATHRYCSLRCFNQTRRPTRGGGGPGGRGHTMRKVERPPREQLLQEVAELGYSATGRKYGVSDNAIRKWLRQYERERALAEGRDPEAIQIPRRTWPKGRGGSTIRR